MRYEEPLMEVQLFMLQDILTASGDLIEDPDGGGSGDGDDDGIIFS